MSKICLKDVAERQTGWFCDGCGERIFGVPETIFSKPLIDKCPHCGVVFTDYELCKTRTDMHSKLISEFPELAAGFNKENKE